MKTLRQLLMKNKIWSIERKHQNDEKIGINEVTKHNEIIKNSLK